MSNMGIAIGIIVGILIVIGVAYYLYKAPTATATTGYTTPTTAATNTTNTTANKATNAIAASTQANAVPIMEVFSSNSVTVNANAPANATVVAPDGVGITVMIPAGTYALVNNSIIKSYKFTIATFKLTNVSSPAGHQNQTPAYGFAFEVNNAIDPTISFVNSTRAPVHLTTVTHYPSTWHSWAYVGGAFNSSTGKYTGGNYLIENAWTYNAVSGTMTNEQFYKPIMWVFTISTVQNATTTVPANATEKTTTTINSSNSTAKTYDLAVGSSATIGNYLENSAGFTLYLLTADKPYKASTCTSTCTTYWLPYEFNGNVSSISVQAGINASALGVITRSDGSKQLTYYGWPLYQFSGDRSAGQTSGEGIQSFGGTWYAVTVPKPTT